MLKGRALKSYGRWPIADFAGSRGVRSTSANGRNISLRLRDWLFASASRGKPSTTGLALKSDRYLF